MSSLLQVNNTQKPEVWGKLVSINSNLNNVDLIHPIYEIGRNTSNKISIQDVRVSGIHCILRRNEQGVVTLEDCSSNGTFLEGQKIGKGNASVLASGRKFELLPATKISKDAMFGYTFSLYTPDVNANKRRREEQEERMIVEHKQIKPPKNDFETEKNKVECLICENYIYQCVTTVPCQHSFCGACYSDSSKKNPSKCPKCGNEVDELKRNKLIDDQVTEFLENYPQQERMTEELREMNKKNKYQKGFIFHRNEKMIEEPPAQNQQGSKNLNNMNLLNNGINGQISNKPNIVGLDTRKNNKIERYHQLISKYIVE